MVVSMPPAAEPSPKYPAVPFPTMVPIIQESIGWLVGTTWRIRLLTVSEMSKLPEESNITSEGPERKALTAGPPSPA